MGSITIRNLDDTVIEKLKAQAKEHERSLEAEVRAILTETSGRWSREHFIKRVQEIAAMTPDVPQSDSTQLIREERDRR
ncbi:MAG: hypothetical protein FJX66_01845 [Alphaproteobacteria bacterium]|nr:hypothetical protein [Alphaproteobacteria bacterium]